MAGPAGKQGVIYRLCYSRARSESHIGKRCWGFNTLHVAHGVKELPPEASTANAGRDEEIKNN